MKHRIRLLSPTGLADIENEMRRAGSEEAGVRIMAPKGEGLVVRIDHVRGKAASLLKQLLLSLGGDACVSREVAAFDDTPRPVVLVGSLRHLQRLCARLPAEPFGLAEIGRELRAVLARRTSPPPPVRIGDRQLVFGEHTLVMGIINTTPDSFSGDGLAGSIETAVTQAREFLAAGADILDIGGESTRPGSEAVAEDDEIRRVVPVIEAVSAATEAVISVDSTKPGVCSRALAAGAHIINDIGGLGDPAMIELAARTGAPVIIMHMQGTPRTMQDNPRYDDLISEVYDFLAGRSEAAQAGGVACSQIIVDPGFGFGKTTAHNLEIVRRLRELRSLGHPVLLGPSRKRTIGEVTGRPVEERLWGTAALCAIGITNGADIIRVHDVAAMKDVALVADAVRCGLHFGLEQGS